MIRTVGSGSSVPVAAIHLVVVLVIRFQIAIIGPDQNSKRHDAALIELYRNLSVAASCWPLLTLFWAAVDDVCLHLPPPISLPPFGIQFQFPKLMNYSNAIRRTVPYAARYST